MSLLRLLSTGKSWVNPKPVGGRYRLPGKGMLPEFGGKANPFRTSATPKAKETAPLLGAHADTDSNRGACPPSASSGLLAPNIVAAEGATQRPAGIVRTTPYGQGPTSVSQPPLSARRPSSFGERVRCGWRAFAAKFLPVSAFQAQSSAKASAPKSPSLRGQKSAVQCELSLDQVKVMRNDLSDADIEIVPRKRLVKVPVGTSAAAAARGTSEVAWSRVSERIFGAGNTT